MPERRQPSRTPNAVRMRSYRARSGITSRALVDLVALGAYLSTLTPDQHAAFVRVIGKDVVRRAEQARERETSRVGTG